MCILLAHKVQCTCRGNVPHQPCDKPSDKPYDSNHAFKKKIKI